MKNHPKRKKAGFFTSLATATILGLESIFGFGCGNSPLSSKPEEEIVLPQKFEQAKSNILYSSLVPQNRLEETERTINSFYSRASKPASKQARGTIWVNSEQEWNQTPDFNKDREVNFPDFLLFAGVFGTYDQDHNLDDNPLIDFNDFLIFAAKFGYDINSRPEVRKNIPTQNLEQVQAFPNPHELNLDDFVSDFFNDPLNYELVENPNLYIAEFDGKNLGTRPYGIFTGSTGLEFRVNKSAPYTLENAVQSSIGINVQENQEFMNEFNFLFGNLEGEGPAYLLNKAYLWEWNIHRLGDGRDPRKWKGPITSKEDIKKAEYAIGKMAEVLKPYLPNGIKIEKGTDYKMLYDETRNKLISPDGWFYWHVNTDDILGSSGAQPSWYNYTSANYSVFPGVALEIHLHELYHVITGGGESENRESVFYGGILADRSSTDYSNFEKALIRACIEERIKRGLTRILN